MRAANLVKIDSVIGRGGGRNTTNIDSGLDAVKTK